MSLLHNLLQVPRKLTPEITHVVSFEAVMQICNVILLMQYHRKAILHFDRMSVLVDIIKWKSVQWWNKFEYVVDRLVRFTEKKISN